MPKNLREIEAVIGRLVRSLYESEPPLPAGLAQLLERERLRTRVGDEDSAPEGTRRV
jgi:hypothetical protein